MNGSQTIQTAGRIGFFCARHFLAVLLTVLAGCLLWTVTYFALLLWAAFAGSGLGGPLTYPAGLLFLLVAGTATSLVLLFPATAFAEWLARRLGFPVLVQIPFSVAFLALLCFAAVGIRSSVSFGVLLFLSLLLPLGLYWWVAQSGPLVLSLLRLVRSVIHRTA
jgi:hypothetical protein